jgi:ferrochelatase
VLERFERPWPVHLLGGRTGSGKTDLLLALAQQGAAVIDLEGLAHHRGSSFGSLGLPPQPSSDHYENRIALELQRLRQADPAFAKLPIRCIRSYYDDPGYVGAMAELIAREIQACPEPSSAHVFFSAHGVPKSYVEEAGDPYQEEIEACARLIMQKLEADLGHSNPFTLAYQSRVGPVEWLKPYTDDALHELGEQGVKDLVVVPISFVSEHIETLEEIDIEYREIATEAGITNFRRVPALDTRPAFIAGLAQLVQHALEGPEVNLDQAAALPTKVKLYPQDKWAWGWNNSSEVWNGRLAMLGFSAFLLELISGQGPLHALGLL